MVFEDELLVIRDCQFQSTDACQIDFSGMPIMLSFTRTSVDDPWKKDFLGFPELLFIKARKPDTR